MATRNEMVAAISDRYVSGSRAEKGRILDEFVAVTKMHRKHAQRLLRRGGPSHRAGARLARRIYDAAVREALIVVWEASDRICGKRLKCLVPDLVNAMEYHGHLQLEPEVRRRLLMMSAATMDRLLGEVRAKAGGRRRRHAVPSALRQSIPVRTFSDWEDPPPGFFEADFVAHSGPRASGSFVQTLVLTDIATGWTECIPLLVRDKSLLTEALTCLKARLPFKMLGLDTDNDSVFLNETVRDYCAAHGIAFTRCRPYRKNDQAWVEQKNGAIVRRIVGYRRFEGIDAATELGTLYALLRLFVNYYQPSFKLAEKTREGAFVRKRYHPPMTPLRRLLNDPRTDTEARYRAEGIGAGVDPVRLLQDIRVQQQKLVEIADIPSDLAIDPKSAPSIDVFLASLKTAWQAGDPSPVARPKPKVPRGRRRPDPLISVNDEIEKWFAAEPWRTARELLNRLKDECPSACGDAQLRTLQRRLKIMRRDAALKMIFNGTSSGPPVERTLQAIDETVG